eukprot:TRINITY_DN12826_c0_g1_i1.p1 TRINITY_DN12826_c0_g1~~TRINITY_DN12826_c0_g1_i1.p1  ORF type:complete len:497 (+),score=111.82 TRINITY_DN12826_c0_g1_i1:109-1491(+)
MEEDVEEDLGGQERESDAVIDEDVHNEIDERLVWRKHAFFLYDLFLSCSLEWPALSVAWLPDVPGESARLALGFQTDGSAPHEVIVVELDCDVEERLVEANPWRSWNCDAIGDVEGFGCSVPSGGVPLRTVARLQHPTEVNRVVPCPHEAHLIATKAASGAVLLYDYKKEVGHVGGGSSPELTLSAPGDESDGFALTWSRLQRNTLASGGNDGRLCIWDVDAARSSSAGAPLHCLKAHTGALCDLSFSSFAPGLLATVGDTDKELRLWDLRAASSASDVARSQISAVVSDDEVLSVDWNYTQEWLLATTGKDTKVNVWDSRSLKSPLHSLQGHRKEAVVVRWAPFRDGMLGSCSADGRLILWDLEPKEAEDAEADGEDEGNRDPPELLFSHSGHPEGHGVSDFAWSSVDHYLMCSVSEDNDLQIWQPSTVFYLESDAEDEEPSSPPTAKRARVDGGEGVA